MEEKIEIILNKIEKCRNELMIVNNSIVGDPEIESAIIDIRLSLRDLSLFICRKFIKKISIKLEEQEKKEVGQVHPLEQYAQDVHDALRTTNISSIQEEINNDLKKLKGKLTSPEQKIAREAGKALANKIG